MIRKILSRIYNIMRYSFISNEKYARIIGVNLGQNCMVATRNWSTEPYLITIGNNVQITRNVTFHTHGGAHVARDKFPNFDVFGKIFVGDNVYIGSGSQIMPGVSIGKGALIAAGSIVSKSVPPHEVWGGVPAKFICTVDEYIARNLKYNVDSKYMSYSQKRKYLLSLSEDKFLKK